MNSEFIVQQSKALAWHVSKLNTNEQIVQLFRRTLSRDPSVEERAIAMNFLKPISANGIVKPPDNAHQLTRLEQLSQMMLMTNEFEFID